MASFQLIRKRGLVFNEQHAGQDAAGSLVQRSLWMDLEEAIGIDQRRAASSPLTRANRLSPAGNPCPVIADGWTKQGWGRCSRVSRAS